VQELICFPYFSGTRNDYGLQISKLQNTFHCVKICTHQEVRGARKKQKSIQVSSYPCSSLPSFLPFVLPSFNVSPCLLPLPTIGHPLPAATLRSTEAKSLQRQNGDHHIVRNYSSTQEYSKSPGDFRLLKLMSTLQ
jgi:hypothetical protein